MPLQGKKKEFDKNNEKEGREASAKRERSDAELELVRSVAISNWMKNPEVRISYFLTRMGFHIGILVGREQRSGDS